MPFGAPMFCALTGFAAARQSRACGSARAGGTYLGVMSAIYAAAAFTFSLEVWRLYTAGAAVLLMSVRWFVSLKAPRMNGVPVRTAFGLCAIAADAVLVGVFASPSGAVITGFIGATFFYFAVLASECAATGFSFRLSTPEAAAVCAVMAVGGLAFSRARIGVVDIGSGAAFLLLLVLGAIGPKAVLSGSISIALGMGLRYPPCALAILGGGAAIAAFGALPRAVCAMTGVGAAAAFGVLFGMPPITVGGMAISMAVGGLMFAAIPKRAVRAIGMYFDFDGSARLAVRHYINRVKADAGNRMLTLSSVFDETARLLGAFGSPKTDFGAAGAAIADKVCPYCSKRKECDEKKAQAAFAAVAERAYSGKAVLTELPEFFTSECAKTAEALSAASAIAVVARERAKKTESEDKAREIVAERLVAVKDVLRGLGAKEAAPVGFDGTAEQRVAQELELRGVECAEAFVADGGVTAVVRSAAADKEKLRRAVSACMKRAYEVTALDKTQASGWSVATLEARPRYEAVYARAGVSKSGGISGDSYTFERIGDRLLVALSDGMGTGSAAGAGSDAAVELIERFYRAGFDSEAALAGVNRFMKMPGGESFSAADVAVCDLDAATVDIIKIGAPACYIKTADTVLKIEGGSLPIGVLDEMRPYSTTKKLYPGQMLVLVTDGVSDCFDGDELPLFINELAPFNPERTAEAILRRALRQVGDTPRDDMTVVAFRLYERKRFCKTA